MTIQASTIHPIIVAIVATLDAALDFGVYDGSPSARPVRGVTQYVAIGVDTLDESQDFKNTAIMDQTWAGLGAVARYETVFINCVAVGIGKSIPLARGMADSALNSVKTNLVLKPTSNSYNALVSQITAVRSKNAGGGAMVHIEFIIQANARIMENA